MFPSVTANCQYYTFEMFHWLKQSSILQPFGFPSLTSNHSVSYIPSSNKVRMMYYKSQVAIVRQGHTIASNRPPGRTERKGKKQSLDEGPLGGTNSVLWGHWPLLPPPPPPPLEPPLAPSHWLHARSLLTPLEVRFSSWKEREQKRADERKTWKQN